MGGFAAVFIAMFLAELGDKTQIAALLFAGEQRASPLIVFLAASSALIASTLVAVALGTAASRVLNAVPIKLIAGIAFVGMGGWMILEHFRAAHQ